VAAFLVTDTEIVTGPTPFNPMRRDAFTSGAKLGEQMSELM
jgi:hypothetical protein